MAAQIAKNDKKEGRRLTAKTFRYIEQAFYVAVAIALSVAGVILFGHVTYRFATHIYRDLPGAILELLDGLLLVFIIGELIHTIAAVIQENLLRTEPFLIVGIVAAIRRLLVITAESERAIGGEHFPDLMWELGLLIAAVLILGTTIFLVRHTESKEPVPAGEDQVESGDQTGRSPGEAR